MGLWNKTNHWRCLDKTCPLSYLDALMELGKNWSVERDT